MRWLRNRRVLAAAALCAGGLAYGAGAVQAAEDDGPAERIQFPAGSFGTTIDDTLAAGAKDLYVLTAGATQSMSVSVTGGALAESAAPGGALIAPPAPSWTVTLPVDGDYYIAVTSAVDTAYQMSVTIVDGAAAAPAPAPTSPPAPAPVALPAPAPGQAMVAPVVLASSAGSVVTDGRYAVAIPHRGAVATAGDGTVIVLADDGSLTTVTLAGAVQTAACSGCRGVAELDGTIYSARDPMTSPDGFEIVTFSLADLSPRATLPAVRTITTEPYPDSDRQYFDVPMMLAVDAAGIVVAYDFEPGGYNARGGGQTAVARYGFDGQLLHNQLTAVGRLEGAEMSPDRRFVALAGTGSFGACYTLNEVSVLDVASFAVTWPKEPIDPDYTTWFMVDSYWDATGLLRGQGRRFDERNGGDLGSYCEDIVVQSWAFSFDPAALTWSSAPSSSVTVAFGPGCSGVATLTNDATYDSGATHVALTVGGAPLALDVSDIAASPSPACDTAPVPETAPAPPPTEAPVTEAPVTQAPVTETPAPAPEDCGPPVLGENQGLTGLSWSGTDCATARDLVTTVSAQHYPWGDPPETSAAGFTCTFTELPISDGGAGRAGRYDCASGAATVTWSFEQGE